MVSWPLSVPLVDGNLVPNLISHLVLLCLWIGGDSGSFLLLACFLALHLYAYLRTLHIAILKNALRRVRNSPLGILSSLVA